MQTTETRIVFASNKGGHLFGSVEFYVFSDQEKDFIPVETEYSKYEIISQSLAAHRPLSTHHHCHSGASYASRGCYVYRAGGNYRTCDQCHAQACHVKYRSRNVDYVKDIASRTVDCWDTKNNRWTTLPLMNVSRYFLHLNILRDKLFAVGGCVNNESAFIEMFNESENRWILHAYPNSVKLDPRGFMSAALEDRGCILLGSSASNSFYAFWPDTGTWEIFGSLKFDRDLLILRCDHSAPAVVVENQLLFIDADGKIIVGFDADSGMVWEIDLVSNGLLPCSESYPNTQLLQVGKGRELALVWRDECECLIEGKIKPRPKDKDGYVMRHLSSETSRAFLCCTFYIDFSRAKKRVECCFDISFKRCVGPNGVHAISAAFAADVGKNAPAASASGSRKERWILPLHKRRRSKRLMCA